MQGRGAAPVATDVFTDGSDEKKKNLVVFLRDSAGRVRALVERRKYDDLRMERKNAGRAR